MESMVTRVRGWLSRNKIFFEIAGGTVVTVLLSITALFVAHQANQIAETQTQLLELQTRLVERQTEAIEIENEPSIHIDVKRYWHSKENPWAYDLLVYVSNEGEPLEHFNIRSKEILLVSYSGDYASSVEAKIPILYTCPYDITGNSTGLLATLCVCNSPITYGERADEFTKWCAGQEKYRSKYGFIYLYWYLMVSYSDRMGKEHADFFRVSEYKVGRVRDENAEEMFSRLPTYLDSEYFALEDATPQRLLELWEERGEMEEGITY